MNNDVCAFAEVFWSGKTPNGILGEAGRGFIKTGEVDAGPGSLETGAPASGELFVGRELGLPRPREEVVEGTTGLGEKMEDGSLPFSGEPGGVVLKGDGGSCTGFPKTLVVVVVGAFSATSGVDVFEVAGT